MAAHKMKDGRWCVWLTLGSDPGSGQRIRKRVEAKTKRECEVKASALRERHARGETVTDKARTVSELLDEWLMTVAHQGKTENTQKAYHCTVKNNLKPHLGAVEVPKLRARVIQKVFNELATRLAPRNIRLVKTVLVQALNLAIEQSEITINPAEKIRVPTVKQTPGRSLTPDEVRAVMLACEGHRYGLAIRLALMGMRRAELPGLRWEDFDEQAGTLLVCRQIQRVENRWVPVPTKDDSDRGNGWHLSPHWNAEREPKHSNSILSRRGIGASAACFDTPIIQPTRCRSTIPDREPRTIEYAIRGTRSYHCTIAWRATCRPASVRARPPS
jgi:integrase